MGGADGTLRIHELPSGKLTASMEGEGQIGALAVTRDVASFLRNSVKDDAGNRNPLAMSAADVGLRRAYAAGTSSTAMYLREWLYLGFNEDEAHRKVFDAVTIHRAGAYRLFANLLSLPRNPALKPHNPVAAGSSKK